jgi:hypothetical protein
MQSFLESVIRGEIFYECLTGLASSYLELTSDYFIYGIIFYSITHFYLLLKFCGPTSNLVAQCGLHTATTPIIWGREEEVQNLS